MIAAPDNGLPIAPAAEVPVQIAALAHTFGTGEQSQPVLRDIDLSVKPGELVILTGRSGCGKTTLLTLIGALRQVQQGSLQVLGTELMGLDRQEQIEVRRGIGFIFQAHNLLDALTAEQNINLGLAIRDYSADELYEHARTMLGILDGAGDPLATVGRTPEAINQALVNGLLAHLQMADKGDHKPKKLSGGQRQRVAIARALVNNPRLILADEPTAALDEAVVSIVIDMLKRLTQHGTAIIVVTHDDRIMEKGDRIVAMADGKITDNTDVESTVALCQELRKVPLLARLTASQLRELAGQMHVESYAGGATIIRQGEVGDKFYLVRKGSVDVFVADGDALPQHVATLDAGKYFGEVALMTGERRNATLVAKGDVEVWALGKADFLAALASAESLREELIKVFSLRFRHH